MPTNGNDSRNTELAHLRRTWGTRYEIGEVMGIWRAQRLTDTKRALSAGSPMELRAMLLRDFSQ